MDQKILVLNWKSNKTPSAARNFLEEFPADFKSPHKIVLCPDYLSVSLSKDIIEKKKIGFSIGAQDLSRFGQGAYTGEVSGKSLSELVEFVLIGHAERRRLFHENKDILKEKMTQAKENNLKTVLCVEGESDLEGFDPDFVAYEPESSIGSGVVEDLSKIEEAFEKIKKMTNAPLLYGGSVNYNELEDLKKVNNLSGLLVGSASLEVESVLNIVSSL